MSTTNLLPGITQHTLKTPRLTVAHLEAGSGDTPIVLIHGNCASSLFFQDFMLALAATHKYSVYAPDMRGFGDTDTLPVDATRGLSDFADDLDSFAKALNLTALHLLGWSLGANVAMQYAIDYPGTLRSLTLESPRGAWSGLMPQAVVAARLIQSLSNASQRVIAAANSSHRVPS